MLDQLTTASAEFNKSAEQTANVTQIMAQNLSQVSAVADAQLTSVEHIQ